MPSAGFWEKDMDKVCQLFMDAVAAALKNETVSWDDSVTSIQWAQVLSLAETHRMLPMIYQATYRCPGAQAADPRLLARYKMIAIQMVAIQAQKTAEFLPLLRELKEAGVEPMVVKGILCRRLYPNPDHRMSSDEDVLILPEQFPACHQVLTRYGLTTADPETDAYEIPYSRPGGVLYLEIHRSLFPDGQKAYGDLNRFFRTVRDRAVEIDGVPTMAPTDHMLYLLCHAFKHFLHSGFGIRQVCDLILFANRFGSQIDWLEVLDRCRQIRAEQFAAGLFRIGWKYLGFSLEHSRFPIQWQAIYVDEEPLLLDILLSGIYGGATMSRQHSSTITLEAVAAQRQGKKSSGGVRKSLFPPAKDLEGRYPYLKTKPFLLPVAWTSRILHYRKETAGSRSNNPGDALRIGSERIDLLKKYGVLDK
jgi:hypothetical protein